MKPFPLALLISLGICLIGFLIISVPNYYDLFAHQSGRAPMSEVTSFPPGYAFFAAGYVAAVVFVPVTLVVWLGICGVSMLRPAKRGVKI